MHGVIVQYFSVITLQTETESFGNTVERIPSHYDQWRGAVAQFRPIRIPMSSFLPLPSVMPSTFPFPLLSFSLPLPFPPFSLRPLLNLGTWIQLPKFFIANLDVRTCILMCIVYVENSH